MVVAAVPAPELDGHEQEHPEALASGEASALQVLRQIGPGKTAFVIDGNLAREVTPGQLAERLGTVLGQPGQQPQLFAFVADHDTPLAQELSRQGYRVYTEAEARELKQALREQFERGTLATAFFIASPEALRSAAWLKLDPPAQLTLTLAGAQLDASALARLLAETKMRTDIITPTEAAWLWSRV